MAVAGSQGSAGVVAEIAAAPTGGAGEGSGRGGVEDGGGVPASTRPCQSVSEVRVTLGSKAGPEWR